MDKLTIFLGSENKYPGTFFDLYWYIPISQFGSTQGELPIHEKSTNPDLLLSLLFRIDSTPLSPISTSDFLVL